MYQSTSKMIALAWLPLPFGNLMCKGALYLNEHVIFAFGKDGGGAMDFDEDHIKHHFLMDVPQGAQVMNWSTYAIQFAILIAINFELMPEDPKQRLRVMTSCVILVVLVAGARVGYDLSKELKVFMLSQGMQA